MSNARILADLMGTSTTVPSSKLSLAAGDLPSGSVLQAVSTERTDTDSWDGMADIFSLNITPISTSSKILVQFSCFCSGTNRYNGFKLYRDSTQIALGDANGNRTPLWIAMEANNDEQSQGYVSRHVSGSYLDSPSTTSQITYKINGGNYYGASGYTFYLNRPPLDGDAIYFGLGSTNLILMEIAG